MIYNEEYHLNSEETDNSPEKEAEPSPAEHEGKVGHDDACCGTLNKEADIQAAEPEIEPTDSLPAPPPPASLVGAEPENEETPQTELPQTPPSCGPGGSPARSLSAPAKFAEACAVNQELWAPKMFRGKRWETVNTELMDLPFVEILVEKLQVAPVMVALGFIVLAFGFLLYGIGGQLVSALLGIAYPAYESFKAVEEFANMSDQSELYQRAASMQFWLTYWIVVAAVNTAECALYYMLVWIPFYYPMKVTFLLYLFWPRTRGANIVYHWFVSPFLKRNQKKIDATLEESSQKVRKSFSRAATGAVDASLGAGHKGVATVKRAMTAVGPGIATVRTIVGAEIARRRTRTETSVTSEDAE